MAKEYEVAFELSGKLDPTLKRAFDGVTHNVSDLESELKMIQRSKSMDHLGKEARNSAGSFDKLKNSAEGFKDVLGRVAQYTGAYAIISSVTDTFSNAVGEVISFKDSLQQVAAATGATVEEMESIRSVTQDLYGKGMGENFEDIASAITTVKQVTHETGDALEGITQNAIAFRDVFGEEITQSIKASDTMMKNFGITSEESYNLLAQGAQKGLNKSDELIDTANEYSVYYKTLGYSANEMFNQFSSGLEAGAFNLDKVGDSVKEFGIRIKDGSDSTIDAMAMLFAPDDIDQFTQRLMKGSAKSAEYMELLKHVSKDTAKELVKNLKAGGKKSSNAFEALQGIMGQGNDILDGLSSGAIRGKDAMEKVINKLGEIEDPMQRSTIGVALFGTQFEDMESDVIAALGTARSQFDMTKNTMEEITKIKYDSLTKDLQVLGRELMTEVIIPIGEDLMPVLRDMTEWASNNKDTIKAIALTVAAAMLTKNTVSIVKDYTRVAQSLGKVTGNTTKFGAAAGLLSNPIGIAVGAVGALTLGVIAYKKHQEAARKAILHMGDSIREAYDNFSEVEKQTTKTKDLTTEYDRLIKKLGDVKTPAEQLAEARRKLANVEQELIDLNPEILSAEDAKSGRFREQVGLANELNETTLAMTKRELNNEIINGESNLPKLEEDYTRLTKKAKEYDQANIDSEKSYVRLNEYLERRNAIMDNPNLSSDQAMAQIQKLAAEVKNITGEDFGDQLQLLDDAPPALLKYTNETLSNLKATQEEMKAAENSFQELYDNKIALIQLNLGVGETIDSQSAKYKNLSAEEKERFAKVIRDVQELNREMDKLPADKKIDISVAWNQIGNIPASVPNVARIGGRGQQVQEYARGGVVSRPELAWVGEGGDNEVIIPINGSQRSRDLYSTAGSMLGASDSSGSGGSYVFNPTYNVYGNANKNDLEGLAQKTKSDWETGLAAYERKQSRVSMRG
ncbi:phage tail tape measure protein [Paenibacillus macquariensis]|uniref:Phage-related minor tail protein n=1 Tax=Paenibacillus macquariensis TaxID=948756 RepID=A0ABY1K6Y2_9BACL|nr:phage tail tape measure protein [Paenibacillus macquariensis]MEC0092503.1 phage tail tape measure protein [Paenibacillus macquariensis]OAB35461.1 hypothetical protein PMSM_09400 [Paenibacillus macquariensis subsp. macquariensis]SIR35276.1 Phage-related minor tail protein [Paenibacillus macquariensis]